MLVVVDADAAYDLFLKGPRKLDFVLLTTPPGCQASTLRYKPISFQFEIVFLFLPFFVVSALFFGNPPRYCCWSERFSLALEAPSRPSMRVVLPCVAAYIRLRLK